MKKIISLLLFVSSIQIHAEDVIFMVHPIYAQQRSTEVFQPLVDYLEKNTGHNISLVVPKSFLFFWNKLRAKKGYDFVLLEPHLMDYGLQKLNLIPLVKSNLATQFSLLVSDKYAEEDPSEALIGRIIATLPAPCMGNVLLGFIFPNPIKQPRISTTAPSWRDGIESIFAGEADAAIVPTWLAERYPNLTAVIDSSPVSGFAIASQQTTDPAVQNSIKEALLLLGVDKNEKELEVLIELKTERFESANASDFAGLSQLLTHVFGY